MKLKKSQDQDMTAVNTSAGTVIADRFKLDPVESTGKSSGGVGAMIALICSLLSIAMLGATAWLIYQNLELV